MDFNSKIFIVIIEIQYLLITEIKMDEKNNNQNNHCQPLWTILKIYCNQNGKLCW